jgi:hypothetical protein
MQYMQTCPAKKDFKLVFCKNETIVLKKLVFKKVGK